jgi:hypothetical protein
MLAGTGVPSAAATLTTTTSGWPFGGATGWKSRHALALNVYSWSPTCTFSGAEANEADSEWQHLHAVPHPVTAISTAQQRRTMLTVSLFIAPL